MSSSSVAPCFVERTSTPLSSVPPWVFGLLGGSMDAAGPQSPIDPVSFDGLPATIALERRMLAPAKGSRYRLLSYRLRDAVDLDAAAFEAGCAAAYRALARDLEAPRRRGESAANHPVRLWNFVPWILEPLGGLEHRYMVFNAGRYRALAEHLGGSSRFDQRVATASGVGHFGRDFWLHCLASVEDGSPVENPRQTPAYRYSERFGPLPPCFARATRVHAAASMLLVGGTASVVGEASHHVGDLGRQLDETFRNLATLVHVGVLNGHRLPGDPLPTDEGLEPLLHRYRSLRVYYPRAQDLETIRGSLAARMAPGTEIEFVHADLCRPELWVEIEGVACLAPEESLQSVQRTRFESGLLAAAGLGRRSV